MRFTPPCSVQCYAQYCIATVLLYASSVSATNSSSPTSPNVVLIIADDLGYNDLGIRNGGKTLTPEIDSLISGGVTLTDYYTFRVCAPSRASIQTGRYPWGVGFYDMSDDSEHCVDPQVKMLPQLMKEKGYRTHMIGKWDVGYVLRECLPTSRGYDTFLGYYTACTADYWMHGAPGSGAAKGPCDDVDFHDSTSSELSGAAMTGKDSLNGTYDQVVFTERAVKYIHETAAQHADAATAQQDKQPLFMVVAYHNVHDACQQDRYTSGLNAPLETVQLYNTTRLDTWKLQGAMTTELDYGVANITTALKDAGLWDNTVLIFMSDNGGPLDHSTNAPLRGGKGSNYEGGVRVESFVHSPLITDSGKSWSGLAHSSDWYATIYEGIAGGNLKAQSTGPRAPDGHNLWPALSGGNVTSPRTEVIHAVQNQYFNHTGGHCATCKPNVRVAAARFGDWKVITGASCTGANVVSWPEPSAEEVPFGLSTGWVREGTNWAYAGLLNHSQSLGTMSATHTEQVLTPDPQCDTGIKQKQVCCLASCTECGCPGGVPHGPGGKDGCCSQIIQRANRTCDEYPPPCVLPPRPAQLPGCLFNLATDLDESTNLRNEPQYAQLWDRLVAKLTERGATGPPLTSAFPLGEKNNTANGLRCEIAKRTGFLFPLDY